MNTPEQIKGHQAKYWADAWKQYTPQELGDWIHLLLKRSAHRTEREKAMKDIADAQNYLHMLQAHVDAAKEDQYKQFD